ncbi:glutamate-1-semialdehyde 2,1-aminomutase [Georgenia alba]|uniref:Glutamate-1-semialdehyde 2,1-aminomutase n=1 Tax=Georgenia alba TaxID=2233858 RepID=A0ABW2Q7A2_9MICO
MEITTTELDGVLLLTPAVHRDDRGLFTRTFDAAAAAEHGIHPGPDCQDSQSRSEPGVIRGLHGRRGDGEAKLVRCARGRILDVVVDARPGSATFGRHLAVELDDVSMRALWIPAGMLHGFQVLSDGPADVCYRIDRPHDPGEDVAVCHDDPELAIPWRPGTARLSPRDAAAGSWSELVAALPASPESPVRPEPRTCRACGAPGGPSDVVLDLGAQPDAKAFPLPDAPTPPTAPLAMWCCTRCGLAQLADAGGEPPGEDTAGEETPGAEPRALREQARRVVADLAADGLLPADGDPAVREFPSPHGGSWLPLLEDRGLRAVDAAADLVIDSFGLMHEPDQAAALAARAAALRQGGLLVLQVHSLAGIVAGRQWNDLRHGHYAYWSTTALTRLLHRTGLTAVWARSYPLYGETVVLAARRAVDLPADHPAPSELTALLAADERAGLTTPGGLRVLDRAARDGARALADHLRAARDRGTSVLGYAAASRAITLLRLAGVGPDLLPAVADASPDKQGRLLPGTEIPVISPEELVARRPDEVLVLLEDLLEELTDTVPELAGRLVAHRPDSPTIGAPSRHVRRFTGSTAAQRRLHTLVPGGAHTYARGEDQYPDGMAPVLVRGRGALVWDVDGNCYVEYGSGLRAVTLGHAHPGVDAAVARVLGDGVNFSRPSTLELAAAEEFLDQVPGADQVKFAKNGSDVTTAAVRLARAATGRDRIAICDQSFFSVDDWFIAHTPMDRGVPAASRAAGTLFPYGDLQALEELLDAHGEELAAVVMQPATATAEPPPGYLEGVRALCRRHGVVLIFDEIITGFRWAAGGVQALSGVTPDLACWGKGIGNGYAISALTGRADLMELGGLRTDQPRSFLLSTTYGPESVGLAALRAVLAEHRDHEPLAALHRTGEELRNALTAVVADAGLTDHVRITGHPACLMFATLDADGRPSQAMRTVLLAGLLTNGVLGQSLVTSAAHGPAEVDHTARAFTRALPDYARALSDGPETVLAGRAVAPALRSLAAPRRVRG